MGLKLRYSTKLAGLGKANISVLPVRLLRRSMRLRNLQKTRQAQHCTIN